MQVKRTGLKRLECVQSCGCIAYMTLSQLERHGMPLCPCGGRMVPEDLEVAALVMSREELAGVPAWREFERECSSVLRGQASHVQRGREVRSAESVAAERVTREARRVARERRLSGLVQFNRAAVEAAAMPF